MVDQHVHECPSDGTRFPCNVRHRGGPLLNRYVVSLCPTPHRRPDPPLQGAHCVGDFDGCPSCPDCLFCNYDCCSDCTFDQKVEVSCCPTCNQTTREGTISVQYSNQVCNCEGHDCTTQISYRA